MDRSRSTRSHRQGYWNNRSEYSGTENSGGDPLAISSRRGNYSEEMDQVSSNARPTRPSFTSSFRSVAYPSKMDPFSDLEEEPFFDDQRLGVRPRADSFSEGEDMHRYCGSTSDAEDAPRDYQGDFTSSTRKRRKTGSSTRPTPTASCSDTNEEEYEGYDFRPSAETSSTRDRIYGRSSRKYEDDRTYPVPKDSFEDLRRPSRKYEDDRTYPVPKDSFEDPRERIAEDLPYRIFPDGPSANSIRGVDMNIVAIIYIGISVTFRRIPETRVYALMERFLQEHDRYAARNIDQRRIEEIYEYMKSEKAANHYLDMDSERVHEFEMETRLSHFISCVEETDRRHE